MFAGLVPANQPAGSPLEIQAVSAATVFFSHNKSAGTVFFSQVLDQRTGPLWIESGKANGAPPNLA